MKTSPVLMIHGLIGDLNDPEIVRTIGGAVLAPDLLGYGRFADAAQPATLQAQVEHLRAQMLGAGIDSAHLVGHSIGGPIALLFASKYPQLTKTILNVEGNFTLKDAFWSRQIASMSAAAFDAILTANRADPAQWLRAAGVEITAQRQAKALHYLQHQPASTLRAMAQSVVTITAAPDYLQMAREVCRRIPFHLVAGEKSLPEWDVPPWALEGAQSLNVIPGAGHMMMLEAPMAFAAVVRELTRPPLD